MDKDTEARREASGPGLPASLWQNVPPAAGPLCLSPRCPAKQSPRPQEEGLRGSVRASRGGSRGERPLAPVCLLTPSTASRRSCPPSWSPALASAFLPTPLRATRHGPYVSPGAGRLCDACQISPGRLPGGGGVLWALIVDPGKADGRASQGWARLGQRGGGGGARGGPVALGGCSEWREG